MKPDTVEPKRGGGRQSLPRSGGSILKRSVIALVALLIGVAAATLWGGVERLGLRVAMPRAVPAVAQTPAAPRPVPVETVLAQVDEMADEVEALGTLMADESVAIAPEIAGRLVKLGFREGDHVKRGQTLVELDTTILAQELKQAEVDLGLSRDTFERANSLVQRGSGTRVSLEQAQAQLAAAEVRGSLARARLEKATITAPIDGIVGLRAVSAGTYLTPGQTIVTLANLDPIKVDFRVPELLLQNVGNRQRIRVRVDALPGRSFDGEVYAIDPLVDVNGRAIRLRAHIANPDFLLKPGLFARVTVVTAIRPDAVVVPESAVFPDGDAKALYVVEEGRAKLTRVRLGKRQPGRVEIAEGVRRGQRVVTTGQFRLRDGSPVEMPWSQAQAAATVLR